MSFELAPDTPEFNTINVSEIVVLVDDTVVVVPETVKLPEMYTSFKPAEDEPKSYVLSVSNKMCAFNAVVPKFDKSVFAVSWPPAVEPSCTWIVFLVVFTVNSPAKPVKEPCSAAVPLRL